MIADIAEFINSLDGGLLVNLLVINVLFLIHHLFFGGPRVSDWDGRTLKHVHVWLVVANIGLIAYLNAA